MKMLQFVFFKIVNDKLENGWKKFKRQNDLAKVQIQLY